MPQITAPNICRFYWYLYSGLHWNLISYFDFILICFGDNLTYVGVPNANRCRAVWGVGLLPFACWDCGFESRREMGVCLLWVLCVVRKGFLLLANHQYTGNLQSVVCPKIVVANSRKVTSRSEIRPKHHWGREGLPKYLHDYLHCYFFENILKPKFYTNL